MLAVCQPSVPAFAAAALMSADKHPCRPKTLSMMGGPIDTRKAPTEVNTVATQRPFAWFEQNVIATVPYLYPGGGRKVYRASCISPASCDNLAPPRTLELFSSSSRRCEARRQQISTRISLGSAP